MAEARHASYPAWAAEGDLIVTSGEETDFRRLKTISSNSAGASRSSVIAYDPWASTYLRSGWRPKTCRWSNFARPRKFQRAYQGARRGDALAAAAHDGNGLLTWCIGNVVGHYDARGNVFPSKARPRTKSTARSPRSWQSRAYTAPGPWVYENPRAGVARMNLWGWLRVPPVCRACRRARASDRAQAARGFGRLFNCLAFPQPLLYAALGGYASNTGVPVTPMTALQSAVYGCIKCIGEDIAGLPPDPAQVSWRLGGRSAASSE